MNIVIRPFDRETDTGLILDSWPKNAFHSAAHPIEASKSEWFARMHLYIQVELKRATTLIACSSEDPNLIAGYMVVDEECLEFIWVKPRYRGAGIAALLLSRRPIARFNPISLTKDGKKLINEYGLKEKNDEKA